MGLLRSIGYDEMPPKTKRLLKASVAVFVAAMIVSEVLDIWLDSWFASYLTGAVMIIVLAPLAWSARKERGQLDREHDL